MLMWYGRPKVPPTIALQNAKKVTLEAQWVPPTNLQLHYKMQKIWLDVQETLNFRNNIEALQNAKPGAFFFDEKLVLVQNAGPRRN